jgi:hypothetical protein
MGRAAGILTGENGGGELFFDGDLAIWKKWCNFAQFF